MRKMKARARQIIPVTFSSLQQRLHKDMKKRKKKKSLEMIELPQNQVDLVK